jgi:hypothetical protein
MRHRLRLGPLGALYRYLPGDKAEKLFSDYRVTVIMFSSVTVSVLHEHDQNQIFNKELQKYASYSLLAQSCEKCVSLWLGMVQ